MKLTGRDYSAVTKSRWRKAAAGAALVGSAYSFSLVASTDYALLGCLTLLPLFAAIRVCRPLGAGLAGAVWGLSLYAFSVAGIGRAIEPSALSLALLTGVPAVYACLGACLTRWIGFSPLVLGVSWMGIELALTAMGLQGGLLVGAFTAGTSLNWASQAFGYVVTAFLVAYFSALLLDALSRVQVVLGGRPLAIAPPDAARRLLPKESLRVLTHLIHLVQPRAPPMALR